MEQANNAQTATTNICNSFLDDELNINNDVIHINNETDSDNETENDIDSFDILDYITQAMNTLNFHNKNLVKIMKYRDKENEYKIAIEKTQNVLLDAQFDYKESIKNEQLQLFELEEKYKLENSTSHFAFLKNNNNIALIEKKTKIINDNISTLNNKYNKYKESSQQYKFNDINENTTIEINKINDEIRTILHDLLEKTNIHTPLYLDRTVINESIELVKFEHDIDNITHTYFSFIYTIYNKLYKMFNLQCVQLQSVFNNNILTRIFIFYFIYKIDFTKELSYNYELFMKCMYVFYISIFIMYNSINLLFTNNIDNTHTLLILPTFNITNIMNKKIFTNNVIVQDMSLVIELCITSNFFSKLILSIYYFNMIRHFYVLTDNIKSSVLFATSAQITISYLSFYIVNKFARYNK